MTSKLEAVDLTALRTFKAKYGSRAMKLPPIVVIIAAFNEAANIRPVVTSLPKMVLGLKTAAIVISDGSIDNTAEEASKAGALVCAVPINRGQGAALRLGYELANEGGAKYIVTFDADGQYDPAEIKEIIKPILDNKADFVAGSRKLGTEDTRDWMRRLGVWFFAKSISVLTGQRITDPSFGLRAMRSEVVKSIQLNQPQYQASELLIGVICRGYRVTEVPASIHPRKNGKSKKGNNLYYGIRFASVIIRTWWRER